MILDSFIFSDPGGRENNEDSAGERRFSDGGIFVVADGLGGHEDGEQASRAVCETLLTASVPEDGNWENWLESRFDEAGKAVRTLQVQKRSGMKSTAAALLLQNGRAYWGHIGDTRLYYFHNDDLVTCTADHSVSYKKYLAGEITRGQIGQDEDQNRLLRSVGSQDLSHGMPDIGGAENIVRGDGFLLCSDGVWKYLPDGEILVDFLKTETAQEWGQLMLLRVASRVEPDYDNLTLITVRVS